MYDTSFFCVETKLGQVFSSDFNLDFSVNKTVQLVFSCCLHEYFRSKLTTRIADVNQMMSPGCLILCYPFALLVFLFLTGLEL